MFDQVRYGPYRTMIDVDQALSLFERQEVTKEFVNRPLYMGSDVLPTLKRDDLQLFSYYIGQSGFVVVYDLEGVKLTQVKTEV